MSLTRREFIKIASTVGAGLCLIPYPLGQDKTAITATQFVKNCYKNGAYLNDPTDMQIFRTTYEITRSSTLALRPDIHPTRDIFGRHIKSLGLQSIYGIKQDYHRKSREGGLPIKSFSGAIELIGRKPTTEDKFHFVYTRMFHMTEFKDFDATRFEMFSECILVKGER